MKKKTILLFMLILGTLQVRAGKLQVNIDERIELVTTIQLLSGYKYLAQGDIAYKKEVAETFAPYKGHKAVQYYHTISAWFYASAPLSFILHYDLPDFRQTIPFNNEDSTLFRYAEKRDSLNQFVGLLREFYEETKFHDFYTAHAGFYNTIAAPITTIASSKDFAGIMEAHYGSKNAGYHIILSPLQMDAGFSAAHHSKRGDIQYAIVGPNYDSKDMPEFNGEVLYKELVIHEFSHAFCNPLIDKFYTTLENDSCLFTPIKKAMKEQGYSNWKSCLEELLTRANEIVLNKIIFGKDDADKLYEQNIADSWIYLDGLIPIIENEYLPKRNTYRTQEQVMPLIITYFDNKSKTCP